MREREDTDCRRIAVYDSATVLFRFVFPLSAQHSRLQGRCKDGFKVSSEDGFLLAWASVNFFCDNAALASIEHRLVELREPLLYALYLFDEVAVNRRRLRLVGRSREDFLHSAVTACDE
jgi:hypothetical protein